MGKRKHRVLIVDDEKMVSKALGRILKKIGVDFVSCESGKQGLEELTKAEFPFSLLISDQRMPDMVGSELLEQAREESPETIRFLISGYSDTDVLVDAINKGFVQKFIQKPWDIDDLVDKVKEGLTQFRNTFENEKLVRITKKQSKKLYQLSNELNEKITKNKKNVEELDQKISQIKTEVGKVKIGENGESRLSVENFEKMFEQHDVLENDKLNSLYHDTLSELFRQFNDIAQKNGFEMPPLKD
ncbi:MAG: response regulator [Desulfobacterales bacterium]|nr:response regulator [Desulfobacterales bacterium]